MRLVRVVLALVFGLAMAGPETHACPVHSATPASAAHHQDANDGGGGHQEGGHCTCPQACCPSGVSVSLPTPSARWTAATSPVLTVDATPVRALLLPSRKHFLPFALAPPQTLG